MNCTIIPNHNNIFSKTRYKTWLHIFPKQKPSSVTSNTKDTCTTSNRMVDKINCCLNYTSFMLSVLTRWSGFVHT